MDLPITASQAAAQYHQAGWHPIELPAGAKGPPPEGRTGRNGSDLTEPEIQAAYWAGNVGLRMPPDVIGLDVDAYRGGARTLRDLMARCGPLVNTWISHSNRQDGSGIRFYRVPPGLSWVPGLPGLDIIQRVHRYAAVYPSVHPDGRPYEWWDQAEDGPAQSIPLVEELPELPWPWIAVLSRAQDRDLDKQTRAVNHEELAAFISEHNQAEQPSYAGVILAHYTDKWQSGYSRHDSMQHCLTWAMEFVRAGISAAEPTIRELGRVWQDSVSPDVRRAELFSTQRTTEFEAMLRHAVGKALGKTQAQLDKLHDDTVGVPINKGRLLIVNDHPDHASDGLPLPLDWPRFAKDDDEEHNTWLVDGFWPWGRAMALWAGAKTGKSELALWCAAKLALGEHPWTSAPQDPVDIAYFDYEMTVSDLRDRLADFDIDPTKLERLRYFLLPPLHALDVEAGGREIEQLVVRYGIQAVVFDTFGRAVEGEENEADTVRSFYRHTGSRLKRLGVGYLRTDHAGKDATRGQRGSSAKRDDVDVVWRMTRGPRDTVLLNCEGSSRLPWVGPELILNRTEHQAVSYGVTNTVPDAVTHKVKELDAIAFPVDGSRTDATAALVAAGLKAGRTSVLSAALRHRRARP